MAIDRVDIGERGLVASPNLRKKEKLLFVPPSLVVSADYVWSNGEAGEVMKRYDVPDWPLLATCDDDDYDAAVDDDDLGLGGPVGEAFPCIDTKDVIKRRSLSQ